MSKPKNDENSEKMELGNPLEEIEKSSESEDEWVFMPDEVSESSAEKSSVSVEIEKGPEPPKAAANKDFKCRNCSVFISTEDQQNCRLYYPRVKLYRLCEKCPKTAKYLSDALKRANFYH